MDTSKDNNKTNEPDPDPEPFDEDKQSTEKDTYDWVKSKEETFANNASMHNATLDIEKELNAQEDNDKTNNKSKYHNQDISVESSISQIFGTKDSGETEISGEVQDTLCLLLNIHTILEPILKQFKRARWINPSAIINIFGGSLTALTQYIFYHKPSIFIHEFPEFTMNFIRLSRYEIEISHQNNTLSSKNWLKLKKNHAYDTEFINLPNKKKQTLQIL